MIDPDSPHARGFGLVPEPPAISGHICYAIPHDLLCRLDDEFKGVGFVPQKLEAEFAFTASLHAHADWIGLRRWFGARDDLPITYNYLPRETFGHRQRDEELGGFDLATYASLCPDADLVRIEYQLKNAKARTKRLWGIAQAYGGWLMTNPEFLAEHDRLIADFHVEIETWGFPQHAQQVLPGTVPSDCEQINDRINAYGNACDTFFLKWRLLTLAGPGLPVPLQPGMPIPPMIHVHERPQEVGKSFYFPDTFPIPSREELRAQLQESLRGGEPRPAHMAEWDAMVKNDNTAKNRLPRYGRLFEIQHYCRLLRQRHPEALERRLATLKKSLAGFLRCTEASVHADMMLLNKRLGKGWMQRSCALEAVIVDGTSPAPPPRKPRKEKRNGDGVK